MTNEIDRRIGTHVRSLRLAASLTPGRVAHELGISVADYEARESGSARFSAFHIYDLALLFDCRARGFFDGTARLGMRSKAFG